MRFELLTREINWCHRVPVVIAKKKKLKEFRTSGPPTLVLEETGVKAMDTSRLRGRVRVAPLWPHISVDAALVRPLTHTPRTSVCYRACRG